MGEGGGSEATEHYSDKKEIKLIILKIKYFNRLTMTECVK